MNEKRKVRTLNTTEQKKKGFFASDMKTVLSSIVDDFVEPIVKNMVVDGLTNGINLLIFGDAKKREGPSLPFKLNNGIPYTSQNGSPTIYNGYSFTSPQNIRSLNFNAGRFQYETVQLASREEAEYAAAELNKAIADYGFVSVSDYNTLLGISGSPTDYNYGWNTLQGASITETVQGGCILNLPRPVSRNERYFK